MECRKTGYFYSINPENRGVNTSNAARPWTGERMGTPAGHAMQNEKPPGSHPAACAAKVRPGTRPARRDHFRPRISLASALVATSPPYSRTTRAARSTNWRLEEAGCPLA